MLCNNHPAISYISWFGLVIIVKGKKIEVKDDGSTVEAETETPYIVNDSKSCMKYLYWEQDNNPYVLKESNEWIKESTTRKMIYINENGTGTEVPHDDIVVYYNDTGNGVASKLTGEALGKFDELNGKYMIVQEDVDGIKEVLGSEETVDGNTVLERLNKVEKTAEGTVEKISTVEKNFANNKELENLRNNMNISLIEIGEALLYYEDEINEMSKDLEVSTEEKNNISARQTTLTNAYNTLSKYHNELISRLEESEEDNSATILKLNRALSSLGTSITNLNSNVNTSISDNTIAPSELTTMLSFVANVALKNNEYKNAVSDSILLGVGGKLTESVLEIKKTSNNFSQTISEIQYEIDGETGLKKQISDNEAKIEQKANEIISTVSKTYTTTTTTDTLLKEAITEYYLSTSNSTLSGGTWGTTAYIPTPGKYIWQRTKSTTYAGDVKYSTPICISDEAYTIILSNETLLLKCDSEGRVI